VRRGQLALEVRLGDREQRGGRGGVAATGAARWRILHRGAHGGGLDLRLGQALRAHEGDARA